MVDFVLTEEQKEYQKLASDFAQREIQPYAHHFDKTGEFPLAIYEKAFETGLMNLAIPEQWGGLGLGVTETSLIAEEIALGCTGISAAFTANDLALAHLIMAGDVEQIKQFLLPMTNKLSFAASCFTKSSGIAGNTGFEIWSQKDKQDHLVEGEADLVTNASVADWFCVLANAKDKPHTEFSLFLIPKDFEGITISKKESTLGHRAADNHRVVFKNVRLSKDYVLGEIGNGLVTSQKAVDTILPIDSAKAIGLARLALQHCLLYSKQRTTFGQPISSHQAIAFILADMAKDIRAARLMCSEATWLIDKKLSYLPYAQMAAVFASDMAMRVATDAVQIFGGYGYSSEYPVEKLMRDAKMLQVNGRVNSWQRASIAKTLLNSANATI